MDIRDILVLVLFVPWIIFPVLKWKQILAKFLKEKFFEVNFVSESGMVYPVLHWIGKNIHKIRYKDLDYYVTPTKYTMNGHKYFEYDIGNPHPKNIKTKDIERNLVLELKQKEIKFEELWKDPRHPIMDILMLAVPFIVGLIMGILIQTVQNAGG